MRKSVLKSIAAIVICLGMICDCTAVSAMAAEAADSDETISAETESGEEIQAEEEPFEEVTVENESEPMTEHILRRE